MSSSSESRDSDGREQNPAHYDVSKSKDRLPESTGNAARGARQGWTAAARRMRQRGEDRLPIDSPGTRFGREEWEWC